MDVQFLLLVLTSAYSFYFMNRVLKNTRKDAELTKNERTQVIVLLVLNTLISYLILNIGWKNKLPIKAKQVTKYLLNIILALILIGIIAAVLAVIFASLSTNAGR